MVDTGFVVPDDKIDRFAANYGRARDKSLRLLDDPLRERLPQAAARSCRAAAGSCRTTADYLRFAQMLCNGGELDGVAHPRPQDGRADDAEPSARRRRAARSSRCPAATARSASTASASGSRWRSASGRSPNQTIGSAGEFMWGGAASTIFWIDPAEELVVVFMTQLMPSGTFNFRGQLKTLVYPAIVD